MKADPIIAHQRRLTKKGNLMVISAWKVPFRKDCPEGISYSFQLISDNRRVLGYDNNTGEGHHKHYLKNRTLMKTNIEFGGIYKLFKRFQVDVKKFEEKQNENKENKTKDRDTKRF